jgi:hypothetical protein
MGWQERVVVATRTLRLREEQERDARDERAAAWRDAHEEGLTIAEIRSGSLTALSAAGMDVRSLRGISRRMVERAIGRR